MFERTKSCTEAVWTRFRTYSLFVQLLLVVPILFGTILFLLVGNMGLALMGTAIPIHTFAAGWTGSFCTIVLVKAGIIVAKDRNKLR